MEGFEKEARGGQARRELAGRSDREARERAELVRRSFAAAGKGYLPGPEKALPRVA